VDLWAMVERRDGPVHGNIFIKNWTDTGNSWN